jgi:hypothetical protein
VENREELTGRFVAHPKHRIANANSNIAVSDNWDQLHRNILVHLEFPEGRPALPIGISDRAKVASMLKAI